MESVLLCPDERCEIVVKMPPGETVLLRSIKSDCPDAIGYGTNEEFDILDVTGTDELGESEPIDVSGVEWPEETGHEPTRTFMMQSHGAINGKQMDMSQVSAPSFGGGLIYQWPWGGMQQSFQLVQKMWA